MVNKRNLFLKHVGQTSTFPLQLEVEKAEGMYIYDTQGKAYLDFNSGISVSSLGHCHPRVVAAVEKQVRKFMHTMVYGEHIQDPQVLFASLISKHLDPSFTTTYFLNGGSEAVEAGLKIAKRFTHRYEIVAAAGAYHGSTIGAESLRSDIEFTKSFMPGIPGIKHIEFNNTSDLSKITEKTAAVIMEPVQGESGVITPTPDYLKQVSRRCKEVGALFLLDEIQTGFGRTGSLFAHQKYDIIPDMIFIGKAMGSGMPISGVISRKEIMASITQNPALGHITTFGGHPVCLAAAYAGLEELVTTGIIEQVSSKEDLIKSLLNHEIIREVRSSGMMMAVELSKRKYLKHVVAKAMDLGVIIDYFLFNDRSFRLAPPLIASEEDITKGCRLLLEAMDYARDQYK